MKKKRYNYTPDEKVTILKRHLVDKIPVSDICDQYHLQPTVFYRWQKDIKPITQTKKLVQKLPPREKT